MAKYGSASFAVLLADGRNLLAAKLKSFSHKIESITEKSDGLGDGSEEHTPVGVSRATIAQDGGFFDDSTNATHAAYKAAGTTTRILSWAPHGNVIGRTFVGAVGAFKGAYDVLVSVAGLAKANASYVVSGVIDEGVILQEHEPKTIDWNTKTEGFPVDFTVDTGQRVIPITSASKAAASVVTTPIAHGLTTGDLVLISGNSLAGPSINAQLAVTVLSTTTFSVPVNTTGSSGAGTGGSFVRANSSAGGVGYQQVSAFSGFTGFVGTIRDSADDSTYADLIVFANVTSGPEAQRIEVAGVVDRYLSYTGDVTGTGSISPFVGFARY